MSIKVLIDDLNSEGYYDITKQIKAYVYGEGDLKAELENLIQEFCLQETVHLKGQIPNVDVPNVLNEVDIYLITSKHESFGVSVIEAMASRIPVVATDVPGFAEIIVNNETGIIVSSKNPEDIAKELKKLILDEELRHKLGNKGRDRVEKIL